MLRDTPIYSLDFGRLQMCAHYRITIVFETWLLPLKVLLENDADIRDNFYWPDL